MTLIWARDGYYMAYAIGTVDLDAWDHNQAALIEGDLNALDWFHHAAITHTKPKYKKINPMTAGHYPKTVQTGRTLGRLATTHYLQTGILSYAAMGACTSTGNGAEITTVLCLAKADCVENSTFHFWVTDGSEAITEYYCWIEKGGGVDPGETGTAIKCDISGIDTAIEVAGVIAGVINAKANVGAANGGTATVTITNGQNGGVRDCCSWAGTATGFTIAITTQGTTLHTITKATDTNPIRLAFHYEKEGSLAARRKDMEGLIPSMHTISVSEINQIAMQTYLGQFAYTGPGSDLAQPTAHTQKLLAPFTWHDYKNSSGASEFKYNGGAINVDIVDLVMRFGWTGASFGAYDGGYPRNGLVQPPFVGEIDLGVRLTDAAGTGIDTISDLRAVASYEGAAEYAGDLDFIADFYRSATIYTKYTWDKMMIDPESYEEVFKSEGDWFDGCRFTLRFLNKDSSLAIAEKNPLSKIYYENTA